MIGALCTLAVGAILLATPFIFAIQLIQEKKCMDRWIKTEAVVTKSRSKAYMSDSGFSEMGPSTTIHSHPIIRYTYTVDNKRYKGGRFTPYPYSMSKLRKTHKLLFKEQDSITIYYHPENPKRSALYPIVSYGPAWAMGISCWLMGFIIVYASYKAGALAPIFG